MAQSDVCDNLISFLCKHMLVLPSLLKEKIILHYILCQLRLPYFMLAKHYN